jgi:hypothetical protein
MFTYFKEAEYTELGINKLELLAEVISDEIIQNKNYSPEDIFRYSMIQGALSDQRRYLLYARFKIAMGQGNKCPEYFTDQMVAFLGSSVKQAMIFQRKKRIS